MSFTLLKHDGSFEFNVEIVFNVCYNFVKKRGTRETSRKGDPGDEMQMDTNFDFNFKWDEEPPEFISQLDLEVKWDDDEDYSVNKSSKVSLRNVTVNGDYDITGPITNMITQVVNHSYHERLNGKAVKPTPLPKSHQVCNYTVE